MSMPACANAQRANIEQPHVKPVGSRRCMSRIVHREASASGFRCPSAVRSPALRSPALCEHVFVSAGAAHAAFRRAIRRRHLAQTIAAAHDLPVVSLADAFELVLLAAAKDPPTFERAAARWLGRYLTEAHGANLSEATLVLGALAMLGGKHPAAGVTPCSHGQGDGTFATWRRGRVASHEPGEMNRA
jgi:hypothetical protein